MKLEKMLASWELLSGIRGVISAESRAKDLPGVQAFTTANFGLELEFVGREFDGLPLTFEVGSEVHDGRARVVLGARVEFIPAAKTAHALD